MDAPTFGRRLDDIRNDFKLPPHLEMANFAPAPVGGEKWGGFNDEVGCFAGYQIGVGEYSATSKTSAVSLSF